MKKYLLILITISLFLSCASSQRLARVFNENTDSTVKESDRANMFPLFYTSGSSTSILWPLIDTDQHGFSIRPLFNKEKNEYALLFPLSAWNPVSQEGWIGPYYWNENNSALFPIYYKDEDSLQFLNYYSDKNGSCLFPLYFYYNKSNDDRGFYTLLGGYSQNGLDSDTMLAALWWSGSDSEGSYQTLFPLFHKSEYKDEKTLYLFPWLSSSDSHSSTSILLPVFYNNQNQNGDRSFYTFLGGYSKEGESSDLMLTPLWWSGTGPNESYQTLFPISHSYTGKYKKSIYLFPWSSSKGKYTESKKLFPLFSYSQRINDEGELTRKNWHFPMILPVLEKEKTQNGSKISALLGTLFEHKVTDDSSSGDLLLFMADWDKTAESSRFRFPAIFNLTGLVDISRQEETSKVKLLLYSHEKSPESTKRDIFPFITWDSGKDESGFSFLWRVFETHNRNGQKGGHVFFIPYGA